MKLKPGDHVVMSGCYEERKYKERVWTVRSNPWDLCGSEVVLLEGYSGGFATEYLKKVEEVENCSECNGTGHVGSPYELGSYPCTDCEIFWDRVKEDPNGH